jgi:hypothetical protein
MSVVISGSLLKSQIYKQPDILKIVVKNAVIPRSAQCVLAEAIEFGDRVLCKVVGWKRVCNVNGHHARQTRVLRHVGNFGLTVNKLQNALRAVGKKCQQVVENRSNFNRIKSVHGANAMVEALDV